VQSFKNIFRSKFPKFYIIAKNIKEEKEVIEKLIVMTIQNLEDNTTHHFQYPWKPVTCMKSCKSFMHEIDQNCIVT